MPTDHQYALPKGSILHSVYRIEQVLGSGAFGITYLAEHINLQSRSVIKEYFPESLVVRDEQQQVVLKRNADNTLFQWGLDSFFKEAKILHELNHPNIVKVSDLFAENNTAYFVMPYMGSNTLLDWLADHPQPSKSDLEQIFIPLLEGLKYIHECGLLHRDIKPANILLNGNIPVLIDFGSARFAIGKTTPVTQILTPNFAPIEQYSTKGQYNPALDIYSLSACVYQAIAGELPEVATDRIPIDTQKKLADNAEYRKRYDKTWLQAIDKGLSVYAQDRFASAFDMQHALLSGSLKTQKQAKPPKPPKPPKNTADTTVVAPSSSAWGGLLMRLGFLLVLVGVAWFAYPLIKKRLPSSQPAAVANNQPYYDSVELTLNNRKVKYTGWLKNGIAEDNSGKARLIFADGTQCTISMSNNKRTGNGECRYPKGSVYSGAWKNDMKHGYGTYTPPKSSPIESYQGGFVNGKLSGKGILKYKNGANYTGEFANDDIKANSKGSITGMPNMAVPCVGTFTRTRANCTFTQDNKVIRYNGRHKNGLWEGVGELITLQNNQETERYSGTFKSGNLEGKPMQHHPQAEETESDSSEPNTPVMEATEDEDVI